MHYEVRIQGKPVDPYQFIKAGRYVFKEQKLAVADASDTRSSSMTSPNDTFAVLAPNLVVSGNLVSEGNIHIDGTVEGDVQTVHLTIGSSGVVKGRILVER